MDYSRPSQIDEAAYRGVLEHYRCDEAEQLARLIDIARLEPKANKAVEARAGRLVQAVRDKNAHGSGIDALSTPRSNGSFVVSRSATPTSTAT